MQAEPAVVANRLGCRKMAKVILHTSSNLDAINERRLKEIFALTHQQRLKKAFELMKLSLLFKNGALKKT